MIRVSGLVHRNPTKRSLEELWKAQCNDAYWHGVFGGLYLPLLRRAAYYHLTRAQYLTESKIDRRKDWKKVSIEKFDGMPEVRVDTRDLGVCICPWLGGSLGFLSFKPASINLADTLARRKESYHGDLLKNAKSRKFKSIHGTVKPRENELQNLLVYDQYPKTLFSDYLLRPDAKFDNTEKQNLDQNVKLAGQPYQVDKIRSTRSSVMVSLSRKVSTPQNNCKICKEIKVYSDRPILEVSYRVKSSNSATRFATEVNFASWNEKKFERLYGRIGEETRTSRTEIFYSDVKVQLNFSKQVDIWKIPVKSFSQSESGFESNMQCVSLIPNFKLDEFDRFSVRMHMIQQYPSHKQSPDELVG